MKKVSLWHGLALAGLILIVGVSAGVLWRVGMRSDPGGDGSLPRSGVRSGVLQTHSLDEPAGKSDDPHPASLANAPPEKETLPVPPLGPNATDSEKLIRMASSALDGGDIDGAWDRVDDFLEAGGDESDITELLEKLELAEDLEDVQDLTAEGEFEDMRLLVEEFLRAGGDDQGLTELLDALREIGISESEIAELRGGTAGDSGRGPDESFRLGRDGDSSSSSAGEGFRLGRGSEKRADDVIASSMVDPSPALAVFQVTPENAEVFLDGQSLGRAGSLNRQKGGRAVPAGVHTLKITCQGYKSEAYEVVFTPGGVTAVAADLQQER